MNELLKVNVQLVKDKEALQYRLKESREVVEAIRHGRIDAVLATGAGNANILVADTPDQTYRRFIENMREGVVTLLANGVVLYANSSFASIIGMAVDNIVGANFPDIISKKNNEVIEHLFTHPVNFPNNAEISIMHPDGASTHFIVSVSPLQLRDVTAFNLVLTDLTRQKAAEKILMQLNGELESKIEALAVSQQNVLTLNTKLEQNIVTLQEVNIELARFAYIASHDLQEPLRKIRTFGGILKTRYLQQIDPLGQGYIDKMQQCAERMQHLISDILDYSRLSQRDVFNPTDLESIVQEILSDLEIRIDETGANIIIDNTLPVIEANGTQMRQLFLNIISNALKFSRTGISPEIHITWGIQKGNTIDSLGGNEAEEDFCIFYIRDNGIGFKMEYMDKIFTIFQQLNSKALYNGTGIGLAICKRIVEKHHGLIMADSQPGVGSLFTIILPVRQVAQVSTNW